MVDDHGKPNVYLPKTDLKNLQDLIVPYMHPSLLYKIHL